MPAPMIPNRKPLPKNNLSPLPLSAVSALAWTPAHTVFEEEDGLPGNGTIRRLMRYYGDTADKRVPLMLMRSAKALHDSLQTGDLLPESLAADSGDLTHMALWLYNLTGQRALLALCRMLKRQAPDWTSTFHVFSQTKPVRGVPDTGENAFHRVHGRTIAAALKVPALQALFEGGQKNETAFQVGWDKLTRHHGAAHGLFNADPMLAGRNPSKTTGDAVVSELLHSLHVLLWALGNPRIGDILEQIMYNALPAARGGQSANQIKPGGAKSCIANDDVAQSIYMATTDGGLAVILYTDSEVRWLAGGVPARIRVHTPYPFGETVHISIRLKEPARFALLLRIPAWADGAFAEVDGGTRVPCEPGTFASIDRHWTEDNKVTLTLPATIRTLPGHRQSISIMRGPVTYAMPIACGVRWNTALIPTLLPRAIDNQTLAVQGVPVDAWQSYGDTIADLPVAPKVSAGHIHALYLKPYGQTTARIAQFPVAVLTD